MLAIGGDAQRRRRAITEYGAGAQRMTAVLNLEPTLAASNELDSEPGEGATDEIVVGAAIFPPGAHDLERLGRSLQLGAVEPGGTDLGNEEGRGESGWHGHPHQEYPSDRQEGLFWATFRPNILTIVRRRQSCWSVTGAVGYGGRRQTEYPTLS